MSEKSSKPTTSGPEAGKSLSDLADEQQVGLLREFWDFLKYNKKWWLTPIVVVLLLVTVLVVLGNLYPAALPFIYTMH